MNPANFATDDEYGEVQTEVFGRQSEADNGTNVAPDGSGSVCMVSLSQNPEPRHVRMVRARPSSAPSERDSRQPGLCGERSSSGTSSTRTRALDTASTATATGLLSDAAPRRRAAPTGGQRPLLQRRVPAPLPGTPAIRRRKADRGGRIDDGDDHEVPTRDGDSRLARAVARRARASQRAKTFQHAKGAAVAWLERGGPALLEQAEHGSVAGAEPSTVPTFAEYAKTWRSGASSSARHDRADREHVLAVGAPLPRRLPADRITPTVLSGFDRHLEQSLAPKTVETAGRWVRAVLRGAVDDGVLDRMPATGRRKSAAWQRRADVVPMTAEQVLASSGAVPDRSRIGVATAGRCADSDRASSADSRSTG